MLPPCLWNCSDAGEGEGLQVLFTLSSQGMRQVAGEDGVSPGDFGGVVGVLCPVLWGSPVWVVETRHSAWKMV